MRKDWTKEDDERGKKLLSQRHDYFIVAEALGRTPSSVKHRNNRVWKIGWWHWSKEEKAKCVELLMTGMTYEEIGKEMGKSAGAIFRANQRNWRIDRSANCSLRGERHPNYIHGRNVGTSLYRSLIAADKCWVCGETDGQIARHHINFDHYDNRLENLIALCEGCHRKVHDDPFFLVLFMKCMSLSSGQINTQSTSR